MSRTPLLGLVLAFSLAPVRADDKAPELGVPTTVAGVQGPLLARVLQHPNDAKALKSLLDAVSLEIRLQTHFYEDLDAAERGQAQVAALLAHVQPTTDEAKLELERGKRELQTRGKYIAVARTTLADSEAAMVANPDDHDAYMLWQTKQNGELNRILYLDVAAAEKTLAAGKALAQKVGAASRNEKVKNSVRLAQSVSAGGFARRGEDLRLTQARKLLATIGQEAPAIEAQTWIGGSPVTPADWHGKVVVLHSWNLVSDYYMAPISHLTQWQQKLAGQGLLLVSIVRLTNVAWNEEEQRLEYVRREEPIPPADFEAATRKLIAHHKLQHRIAIGESDPANRLVDSTEGRGKLTVIDREGKIRMIRVGPRDAEFREVGKLLTELCGQAGR